MSEQRDIMQLLSVTAVWAICKIGKILCYMCSVSISTGCPTTLFPSQFFVSVLIQQVFLISFFFFTLIYFHYSVFQRATPKRRKNLKNLNFQVLLSSLFSFCLYMDCMAAN